MINFNSNSSDFTPKKFCKESFYYLSKNEISEEMKLIITGSSYQVKKFDIMDIKVGQDQRSVLLIELDILPKIDPQVYLDKLIDNFFIFTYGNGEKSDFIDHGHGNIILPFLKTDLRSIEIHCEMKTDLFFLKDRLKKSEQDFFQIEFLKDIAEKFILELNDSNTICMTSLDGVRIVNRQTNQDINIERMVEKGLKGSRLIDNLSKRYRKIFNVPKMQAPIYNNLEAIIEEAKSLLRRDLEFYNIKLTSNIPKNLNILGQELDFIHCFTNMFKNSIEAIKQGKNSWIKVEIQETRNALTVLVIDSGKGIKKEIQNKIFEPNFTTKMDKNPFIGMGLYMTDQCLKKSGAELLYIEGKNTIFGVCFPSDNYKLISFL